jgi:hypothetical protein
MKEFFVVGVVLLVSCKGHDKPAAGSAAGSGAGSSVSQGSAEARGPKLFGAEDGFEIALPGENPPRIASSPDDVRYETVADEMKRRGLSMPPVADVQYLDGSQHDIDKHYGVIYNVSVEDFGPAAASRSAVLLDERAKELAHYALHPIQYAGMQGLEGSYDETVQGAPPIHNEVRVFAVGGKVFQLMADEQGGADPDHAARKRFFESFKVTKH